MHLHVQYSMSLVYIGSSSGLGYGVWLLGVAGHRMCSSSGGQPITIQRQDLWQAMKLFFVVFFAGSSTFKH